MIPNSYNLIAMSDLPSHPQQVTLAEKIFNTGIFADVVLELKTDNNETREMKVHRALLAKISHVWFQCMESVNNGRLVIEEFSYETIQHMLSFCYTGNVAFESSNTLLNVLKAADHYCISSLINYCTKLLSDDILQLTFNIKDFLLIFDYALTYQNAIIIHSCMEYLEENPKFLFDSNEYSNITLDMILSILKSQHYIASEYELLSFVFCWIRETIKTLKETLDDFIIKSTIIQHLYLNRLSLEELRQFYLKFEKDLPGLFWLNINIFSPLNIPSSLHIRQDAPLRGGENENIFAEIIVRRPPMTIKEKFFVTDMFILESIKVGRRINTSGVQLAVNHLEHITVNIEDVHSSTFSIEAIMPHTPTILIKPNTVIPVPAFDSGFVIFSITLLRPGVYKKNYNFSKKSQKFYRPETGIITHINIYDIEDN